jgi:hypothetical protein
MLGYKALPAPSTHRAHAQPKVLRSESPGLGIKYSGRSVARKQTRGRTVRNGRPLSGPEVAKKPPRKPEGGRAGAPVLAKGLRRKLGRRPLAPCSPGASGWSRRFKSTELYKKELEYETELVHVRTHTPCTLWHFCTQAASGPDPGVWLVALRPFVTSPDLRLRCIIGTCRYYIALSLQ